MDMPSAFPPGTGVNLPSSSVFACASSVCFFGSSFFASSFFACVFSVCPGAAFVFGCAAFCAVAKVGNPLGDLGVVRNDPTVRLVMLHRAFVIPEIHVAQNRKISVRMLEVGGLCQGRLITRARFRKLSLAPLHHTEFVIGD